MTNEVISVLPALESPPEPPCYGVSRAAKGNPALAIRFAVGEVDQESGNGARL